MHELSIAQEILDRVEREVRKHPGARPRTVGVNIGEISGVDRDALAFGFEALVKDTRWEPLALEFEYFPRRHRCPMCGSEFEVRHFETRCIGCGNAETIMISGDELDIGYIEVDDE
jgi:hydrogenase nickel incorporation protein HypA/HybF